MSAVCSFPRFSIIKSQFNDSSDNLVAIQPFHTACQPPVFMTASYPQVVDQPPAKKPADSW
jgi:hypothetical protein